MSKLLLSRDDIRTAVYQYYQNYEPELFRQYDFDVMHFYYEGKHDNLGEIDYVIDERKTVLRRGELTAESEEI